MPPKKSGKEFQWTDDEAELLLTVTNEYKVSKVAEGVDWESVKSKYSDIMELMQQELPSSVEEAGNLLKNYPHTKEQITKPVLTTKLKAIRLKFRQAVDAGKRSGHGRVVMLYYELCERIWAGSPATEQIGAGVESVDIDSAASVSGTTSTLNEPHDHGANDHGDEESAGEESNEGESAAVPGTPPNPPAQGASSDVNNRRELLNDRLKTFRQEKLKRKLPVDVQLLECAKEELAIKKQLIEHMSTADKEYRENMSKLSNNMEKLTNSIADGFSLLRNVLHTPQMYPAYPPTMYSGTHPLGDMQQRSSSPY